MKDIASELGVSVVTVSKVLRNHKDISEETRERVLKRAKELHYQPNFAARALVTGRTYTVGLVVPDLVHPFFAELAMGLSSALRKRSYSLMIVSSEEDAVLERQAIEQMLARRLDALVIASAQTTVESFRRIDENRIPYILIDRHFPDFAANFVGVDDEAVGALATTHLFEMGCRRIAHIRGPELSTGTGRVEGYKRALALHRLPLLPGYIVAGKTGDVDSDISGFDAMRRLLAGDPRPDGVFCYNDPTAMGAMNAVLKAGLRVPEDVAVIGCGNVHYDGYLRVPLTSVDQHSATIGHKAAQLALHLIEAKNRPRPKSIVIPPEVVVRGSTARTR
jgi:LacI family transcriptional regulator